MYGFGDCIWVEQVGEGWQGVGQMIDFILYVVEYVGIVVDGCFFGCVVEFCGECYVQLWIFLVVDVLVGVDYGGLFDVGLIGEFLCCLFYYVVG